MASIPGTFKSQVPLPVTDLSPEAAEVENLFIERGAIFAQSYRMGECSVFLTREPEYKQKRYIWHLSVAHPSRYPTWDEIKTARYGLAKLEGVTMAQILGPVADGEWVDVHENCFHLYEIEPQPR